MTDDTLSGVHPGEAFDPESPDLSAPLIEPKESDQVKAVTVGQVKKALKGATKYLHGFAGERVNADLNMADHEAAMIAPGVARYINARPTLLAGVAVGGDEYLMALVGSIVYSSRVLRERAEALRAEAGDENVQAGPEGGSGIGGPVANPPAPIITGGTL